MQIQTTNQLIREFERVCGPQARWTKDDDGSYCLSLPSGAGAWVAKGDGGKNQKPWYGRVTGATGVTMSVSGWTKAAAQSAAESLLGLR